MKPFRSGFLPKVAYSLRAALADESLTSNIGNLVLRGLSLVSRFILILLVARALGPSEFGVFTLIQTTGIIGVLVLGFELNAFTRREIVTTEDSTLRTRYIRDQFAVSFSLGMLAFPLAYACALAGMFPVRIAPLVGVMILLDLAGQEGTRILYALHRVTAGNLTWFVRSGLWAFVILFLLWRHPEYLTLRGIMSTWVAFEILALILLACFLRKLPWRGALTVPVDWVWLRRGFGIALPFFISVMFVNLLSYMPRYILFYARGAHETGVFGLYTGIASGIVNLVSTTAIPIGMTKAVAAFSQRGEDGLRVEMERLWIQCLLLMMILSVALIVLFPFILPVLGEGNYPLDWLLLLLVEGAFCVQVASLVAQTALYARHRDKAILRNTAIAGTASIPLQFMGAHLAGVHGLAMAMALSMSLMLMLFLRAGRKS